MAANSVLAKMAVEISANNAKFNASLAQSEKRLGQFSKGIGAISGQLKGLVAGFGIYEIGKQIIQTTSQFQKFSAILSNTLGSNSAAQEALKKIKDFAQETPFEVSEITAAYVRWANQGLSPTIDRMGKLGDIASSLGAGFEQTAEAFKDLAVGQTKRLEEIGISATQANGKIQLSFKGVNIEIEKNAEGVQHALDVYSQLNGVLGTSDAVSKTLGGRISNLNDAWANLMLTMGNSSSGPLFAVVESLTRITNTLANLGSELALIGQAISPFHDLSDVSRETLDYLMKFARTDTGKRLNEVLEPFTSQENRQFLQDFEKNHKAFVQTLQNEGESLEDINTLWLHYVKRRMEAVEADEKGNSETRKKEFDDYIKKLNAQAAAAKAAAAEIAALNRVKAGGAALRTGVTNKSDAVGEIMMSVEEKNGVPTTASSYVQQAERISKIMKKMGEGLRINSQEWAIWQAGVSARTQMVNEAIDKHVAKVQKLAEVSQTIGAAIGDVFGTLATNTQNFAASLVRATEQIINMFLQQSIAAMIAASIKDPSTPFPFAKIAMAAAGITAVKALFGGLASSVSGGGGGSVSPPGRTPSEMGGSGYGRAKISGYSLDVVIDKESYRRGRMG